VIEKMYKRASSPSPTLLASARFYWPAIADSATASPKQRCSEFRQLVRRRQLAVFPVPRKRLVFIGLQLEERLPLLSM
jgi:hypothetical protein